MCANRLIKKKKHQMTDSNFITLFPTFMFSLCGLIDLYMYSISQIPLCPSLPADACALRYCFFFVYLRLF